MGKEKNQVLIFIAYYLKVAEASKAEAVWDYFLLVR